MWERFLGDKHFDTLCIIYKLTGFLTKFGRYHEEMDLYKQVLKWQKYILGHKYLDTLRFMNGFARFYLYFGYYQEAIVLFKQI